MILVLDPKRDGWSSFITPTLTHQSSGKLTRLPKNPEVIGVIVTKLPQGQSLSPLGSISRADLSQKEREITKRISSKFLKVPIWLISDSAFYNSLPYQAAHLLVEDRKKVGIDGLVHQSLLAKAAGALGKSPLELNLVTVYLDDVPSVTAIKDGVAIETSPSFSSLGGLPGARSSGLVDGKLIFELVKIHGLAKAEKILMEESGLLGIGKIRGSLAAVLASPRLRRHPQFVLAFKILVHQLTMQLAAYLALLGRCDGLVFSGVLGEKGQFLKDELSVLLPELRRISILTLPAESHLAAAEVLFRRP